MSAVLITAYMVLSGCTEDFCDQAEYGRILRICVDDRILQPEVEISGECTDLTVARPEQDAQCWEARMTGDLESSCVVRVVSGSQVFEEKATLGQYSRCPEYLDVGSIHFSK
jgi:hypothetical protein